MWKRVFSYLIRRLVLLGGISSVLLLVGAFWLTQEIFSPPRRELLTYHLDRLKYPDYFGLKIHQHACLEGKVPCLLVEPSSTHIGKRAQKVRQQLQAKGLSLPAYGRVHGTMVLLHGRNGRKEDLLPIAERFVALGFRCILPDLPAHGESPLPRMAFGSSEFERSLARRTLEDVRQHFNLPHDRAGLWGMSMGGAFAMSAASESPNTWDALIVVSSFADLHDVMQQQIPEKWKIMAKGLYPFINLAQRIHNQPTIEAMEPRRWARLVTTPTLIVHGTDDVFIPLQQGKQLYGAVASSRKQWVTVAGGGHINVLNTKMPLYAEMGTWLVQTVPIGAQVAQR